MLHIISRLSRLSLVVLDCDGVLTCGEKLYDSTGVRLMPFNVVDGFGVRKLLEANVKVRLVSRNKSAIIAARSNDLGHLPFMTGVNSKRHAVSEMAEDVGCEIDEVGFVGDDEFDLEVRPVVGLFISPRDAQPAVRRSSDIVLDAKGGQGAVREVAELVLHAKRFQSELMINGQVETSPVTLSIGRPSGRTLRLALTLHEALLRRGIPCFCAEAGAKTRSRDGVYWGSGDPASMLMLSVQGRRLAILQAVDSYFGDAAVVLDKEPRRFVSIDDITDVVAELTTSWRVCQHSALRKALRPQRAFMKGGERTRLEREIEWQTAVAQTECTRPFIPAFYGAAVSGEYSTYWTGRIFGHSLREIVTNRDLLCLIGLRTLLKSFDTFLTETVWEFYRRAAHPNRATCDWAFYEAKVQTRGRMMEERFGEPHHMFIQRAYRCGFPAEGAVLLPPVDILERLRDAAALRELMTPAKYTMIHGDLHFGNIMYGTDAPNCCRPRLYIVDGKNQRFPGMPAAYGDVAYDVGKLYQSAEGHIDATIAAADSTRRGDADFTGDAVKGDSVDTDFLGMLCAAVSQFSESLAVEWNDPLFATRARLLYGIHMVTMCPCIETLDRNGAAMIYARGVAVMQDTMGRLV